MIITSSFIGVYYGVKRHLRNMSQVIKSYQAQQFKLESFQEKLTLFTFIQLHKYQACFDSVMFLQIILAEAQQTN